MPRGDQTGPMGLGPMTGRAAGLCAGYTAPGCLNSIPRCGEGRYFQRGVGFGRRGGFGFRNRFFATGIPGRAWFNASAGAFTQADPDREKQALKNQADALSAELEAIKKRLDELSANASGK